MGNKPNVSEGPIGGYENQIYNDSWIQEEVESNEEDTLAKIDRALAIEVNIPLDHKGELVSFREVRSWRAPSIGDLTRLKNRINEEWIKPLNLKQQDIVRASGLGAPYVCYLLKDPNSPNMNRRRKIEAYSVLTEMFRKYDAKIITKEDFIRLRNQRIANRFQGPRQDRNLKNAYVHKLQHKRGRRRNTPYGEDGLDDDEELSTIDEEYEDSAHGKLKRRSLGKPDSEWSNNMHMDSMPMYNPYNYVNMYSTIQQKPYYYINGANKRYVNNNEPQQPIPQQQEQPAAWMPGLNVQYYPPDPYIRHLARGQTLNKQGKWVDQQEGCSFIAPYSPNFPMVTRTLFSLKNVIDTPPPICNTLERNYGENKEEGDKANNNKYNESSDYDKWIRTKILSLNKTCTVAGADGERTVFRDPLNYAFMFLIKKTSCLLPIGVNFKDSELLNANNEIIDDIWNLQYLRSYAENMDWLGSNRNWDNLIWVLWDLNETPNSIGALLETWKREYHLSDKNITYVARSFLSQYVYLRDIEIAFTTLQSYAPENEVYTRAVEINCDLIEEKLRIKDTFVWDIRASDWILAALLSNFVSNFQLQAPAISSLFIDLKLTILRYKKEWVQTMLEHMTITGKLQPATVLPDSIGLVM